MQLEEIVVWRRSVDSIVVVWMDGSAPGNFAATWTQPGAQHDLAEIFSQPWVAPVARGQGMAAELSIDLLTGYDLTQAEVQERVLRLWAHNRV